MFIKLKDMYADFKKSDIWISASRSEKKSLNYNNFCILFAKYPTFKEDYKVKIGDKIFHYTRILTNFQANNINLEENITENNDNTHVDFEL